MMPLTFVMVCEAQADFQTASALADRVLCEDVEWIDPQIIESYRQYRGTHSGANYVTWAESAHLSKALGRRVHGHFQGKPGDLDALAGRKAILVVLGQLPEVKAIFLIRDSDGLAARAEGLKQARAEVKAADFAIVIGVAHCKREAWLLAGFERRDEKEQQRLDALRQELGFSPCEQSHELNATHDRDKRSAKRSLALLIQGDKHREISCCFETPLVTLRQRGQNNGLTNYLNEVTQRIVPLFAIHRRET